MTNKEVAKVAKQVAKNLGMKIPPEFYIVKKFEYIYPVPMIYSNDMYQLWVDRYYIAYSRYDEVDVHYIYLKKNHIWEERKNCKESQKEVKLPDNINRVFKDSLLKMKRTNAKYLLEV